MKKALAVGGLAAAVVLVPLVLFVLNILVDILQLILVGAAVGFVLGLLGYFKLSRT